MFDAKVASAHLDDDGERHDWDGQLRHGSRGLATCRVHERAIDEQRLKDDKIRRENTVVVVEVVVVVSVLMLRCCRRRCPLVGPIPQWCAMK